MIGVHAFGPVPSDTALSTEALESPDPSQWLVFPNIREGTELLANYSTKARAPTPLPKPWAARELIPPLAEAGDSEVERLRPAPGARSCLCGYAAGRRRTRQGAHPGYAPAPAVCCVSPAPTSARHPRRLPREGPRTRPTEAVSTWGASVLCRRPPEVAAGSRGRRRAVREALLGPADRTPSPSRPPAPCTLAVPAPLAVGLRRGWSGAAVEAAPRSALIGRPRSPRGRPRALRP